MHVFDVVVPGTFLDYEDRDWLRNIQSLVYSLQSQFVEANLALNLFEESPEVELPPFDQHAWQRDANRRKEIQKDVELERGGHPVEDYQDIMFEVDVRFKREQWAAGKVPRTFTHKTVFIHARAFLYALDNFDRCLEALSRTERVPCVIADLHKRVAEAFPHLRGVRNSAHHLEDRTRQLGARGKPIELKPVDNALIHAPNGALMLDSLLDTKYGSTMADGHYGEVDVSPASMEALREILIGVLSAFTWKGPKSHIPN